MYLEGKMINRIKDYIIQKDLKAQLEEKRKIEKEKNKDKAGLHTIKNKKYNMIKNNILKPLKYIRVEKGEVYELEGLFYKDRVFFDCIKSGVVLIKYYHAKGKDHLSIEGSGVLKPNVELTEGINNAE